MGNPSQIQQMNVEGVFVATEQCHVTCCHANQSHVLTPPMVIAALNVETATISVKLFNTAALYQVYMTLVKNAVALREVFGVQTRHVRQLLVCILSSLNAAESVMGVHLMKEIT